MQKTETKLLLLLVVTTLLLLGCGPRKYDHLPSLGDLASEDLQATKGVSNCSQDLSSNSMLSFKLKSYEMGSTQDQVRHMHLKLTKFPDDFLKDDKNGVEVFVWHYLSDGTIERRVLANFGLERQLGGGRFEQVEIAGRSYLTAAQLKEASITSVASYFADVGFLVDTLDTNGNAKVLTVAVSNEGTILYKASALIPNFIADPTEYQKSGKPSSLVEFHPLKSFLNTVLTASDLQLKISEMCF